MMQLSLAVAIEIWLPELRDPHYGYKVARLRERTAGKSHERPLSLVVLGTSRTTYGLQGKPVEEALTHELGRPVVVFNFGVPGAGPITQLIELRRLLAQGVRPDLLVIEVLPPLLSNEGQVPWEAHWLVPDRLEFADLDLLQRYNLPAAELRRACWTNWPVPWYSHRFAILSRCAPAWLPYQLRLDMFRAIDETGYVPSTERSKSPEQHRRAVDYAYQQYSVYLKDFHLGGLTSRALEDLLDLCRQERISRALLLMPEGSEFRSWYPADSWAQIDSYLQNLSRNYAAPLINAREWVDDNGFTDAHHLRACGAAVFSEKLGRELLRSLLGEHRSPSLTERSVKLGTSEEARP